MTDISPENDKLITKPQLRKRHGGISDATVRRRIIKGIYSEPDGYFGNRPWWRLSTVLRNEQAG